jgi:hypothetical protein
MAQNYVLLETIQLSQTAASVTFDNLPTSGYTDLKVVVSARTSDANTGTIAYLKFNGSSSTYSSTFLQGRGDTTASGNGSTSYGEIGRIPGVNSPPTDNVFSNTEITIPNYLSSNNKVYSVDGVTEADQTIAYTILTAGLWATANPITSILIASTAGNLVASSTFSLYGLAATGTTPAIAPFASGGNIVANDGTYWYHAFLASGTFTPFKGLTCDVLAVGGGGGGAADVGGGAGAGRVLLSSSASLTASNYSIQIGAGGTQGAPGMVGLTTVMLGSGVSISSIGGGAGQGRVPSTSVANTGWNGGGGSYDASRTPTAGNGGFAGGSTSNPGTTNCQAGGGGGAGEAGNTDGIGQGGDGINTYSAWHTATNTGVSGFIAGGGAGGFYSRDSGQTTGGDGGGGQGGHNTTPGTAGVANTGSGGAGGGSSQQGGNGGSGLVIIRYPMV